jgi:phosphoenolpyruvate carboxylase
LEHLPHLLEEYRGVRTVTLQSAIRYDHGEHKARQLAAALKKELPCRQPLLYSDEECAEMSNFIGLFTIQYLDVFSQILPTVCRLSDLLPRQRDRLARISPVGYARDQSRPERLVHFVSDAGVADELKAIRLLPARDLPRAITFTGALYSIGLPPEIIGTGRGLKAIHQRYGQEALDRLLSSYYPGLASDLRWAACFVHLKAAAAFLPEPAMGLIRKDLRMIHHYLDIAMGTPSEAEKRYRTMVARTKPIALQAIQDEAQKFVDSRLIQRLQTRLIEMGKLRGTLG